MLKAIHFNRENLVQLFTKKFLIVILISIPSAIVADFFNIPLAWMIGPMIAVATVNLLGMRVHAVPFGRQMGQVILGSAVSIYFTPPIVAALGANFLPIVLATIAAFVIGGIGALVMSRVSGVDMKSSFWFRAMNLCCILK